MKTIVVMPAYNEKTTVAEAVHNARAYCDEVIVVNDGSRDHTAKLARNAGATVLTHIINRRYTLGAALRTGIAGALLKGADIIITFDADLQHDARDIPRMKEPIEKGEADVVIGSRFLKNYHPTGDHPKGDKLQASALPRRMGGMVANILTFILYGHYVSDTQSGLRAFSRSAAQKLKIKSTKMEVSSEIVGETLHQRLRLKEIPIQPIYTPYALSKGQNLSLGIQTAGRLIMRRILRK